MERLPHNFYSPLRYPGGKGSLAPLIKQIIECNQLFDGCYIEPYAGGGGIAWSLLLEEYVQDVFINDISISVHSFWLSVLEQTTDLCRLIHDTEVTMDEWRRQKAIQSDENASQLELGFSTFFLNRTNRSGIIDGGVIGGQGQKGKWKIDARFNKDDLIRRIERIANYRSRIHLFGMDAKEFLMSVLPTLPTRSLLYLDPPYYVKGEGLYLHHYNHDDHVEIARTVDCIEYCHWIVSYDNTPPIIKLFNNYRRIEYSLSYSAQNRYAGAEVMFFSNGLQLPTIFQIPGPTTPKLIEFCAQNDSIVAAI